MISYIIDNYKKNEVSFYLALENYLTNKKNVDDIFFLWNIDKSIVVGRNQLIQSEINVSYVNQNSINVYRRPSGGGTIYADDGCFMFTFIINKKESIELVYKEYLQKIINALQKININTYFSGRNDLMFNYKKFSGNAIYYSNDYIVLHGTFLYNTDLVELIKCITPDNKKLISKGIKSVSERVTNLKEYMDFTNKTDLMEYLLNSIGSISNLEYDIDKIETIKKTFDDYNWIWYHNPKYQFRNKKIYKSGIMEVFIDLEMNKIKYISLHGDFFSNNLDEFLSAFIGINFIYVDFIKILNYNNIGNYIEKANNDDFIDLIFGGENEQ